MISAVFEAQAQAFGHSRWAGMKLREGRPSRRVNRVEVKGVASDTFPLSLKLGDRQEVRQGSRQGIHEILKFPQY